MFWGLEKACKRRHDLSNRLQYGHCTISERLVSTSVGLVCNLSNRMNFNPPHELQPTREKWQETRWEGLASGPHMLVHFSTEACMRSGKLINQQPHASEGVMRPPHVAKGSHNTQVIEAQVVASCQCR